MNNKGAGVDQAVLSTVCPEPPVFFITVRFKAVFLILFSVLLVLVSVSVHEYTQSMFRAKVRKLFLAPQIEYSAFFSRFNKAYLLSLYKINFLTRGSDNNRIASRSP